MYDKHIHITQSGAKNCTYLRQAYGHGNRMTYDRILVTRSSLTSRDHMPDEVRRWRTKRHN